MFDCIKHTVVLL